MLYPGLYGQVVNKYEKDINKAVIGLRNAFRENDKPQWVRGFRRGTIDEHVLTPLVIANTIGPHETTRVMRQGYKRRVDPISRRYSVQVMVDCSGSTASYNIGVEKVISASFCEMFQRVGVSFSLIGHSGSSNVYMQLVVKDWEDPWDAEHKSKLFKLRGYYENYDGTAMKVALDRVKKKPGPIIIYFSDGLFPAGNADWEGPLALRAIKEARDSGVLLIAVGVRNDGIMSKGFNYAIRADTPRDGAIKLVPLLQKLLLNPNRR